jgi:hypothetical protein
MLLRRGERWEGELFGKKLNGLGEERKRAKVHLIGVFVLLDHLRLIYF